MRPFNKLTVTSVAFIVGIVGATALILSWRLSQAAEAPAVPHPHVIIATPTQISSGAFYVANHEGMFSKRGIDVTLEPFILGKQALQAVMQNKADLAVAAETPFMFSVMKGEKIATVAALFGSRRSIAVVARKDRGINSAEDLRGKTIGTMFGTNAQFFIDTVLLAHAVEKSAVTILDIKPDAMVETLKNGDVDAVTVWNPDLAKLQQLFGDRVVTLYDEGIFVYRFLLIGKQEYIDKHPKEIQKILLALDDANKFIHRNPNPSQLLVGNALGMDSMYLHKTFDPNDFGLALDQTLLLALSDQTRWAIKQGLIAREPIPNYLNYIRQEALETVMPNAIKIIH